MIFLCDVFLDRNASTFTDINSHKIVPLYFMKFFETIVGIKNYYF